MLKLVNLGQIYSLDIPSEQAFLNIPQCPSGYNLNPITNTCTPIQVTTATLPITMPSSTVYPSGVSIATTQCPAGFTLNPATGICIPFAPQPSAQPIIEAMQKYMPYLLIGGLAITAIIVYKSIKK
jgi:hypothetical protein